MTDLAAGRDYAAQITLLLELRHAREWEDANLPIYGSLLGRDLVLLLAQHFLETRQFTLKEIYYSLPYSENAIRLHLQRLSREGWITLNSPGVDRRFKSVVLTEKLAEALQSYLNMLLKLYAGAR